MTVYLVRHARTVRRAEWEGPDDLRPLAPGGHRQALRLPSLLDPRPLARVLASPLLRCRQTVEPLAAQRELPLELHERLREGAPLDGALDLLASLAGRDAVVCTHGDLIPAMLRRLCVPGLGREIACEKGSLWALAGPPHGPWHGTYVAPPARRRRGGPASPEGTSAPLEGDVARLAVVDLGSTSFHLIVADATPSGELRRILRERAMLRLGALVSTGSRIPEAVCERAVATAAALRRHADDAGAQQVLAVATSALRDAENGAELAARLSDALRAPVRILSGVEEARLIFAAFRRRLPLGRGRSLGLDLGGGSLELAVGDGADVCYEATLPVGVARLHGELVHSDPMAPKERARIRARVRELCVPHRSEIARRAPATAVATGGTVGALARRIATRRTSWSTRAVGQLFVPAAEMRELCDELVASTHAERLRTPGLQRPRADLLPTGAVVLDVVVAELGLPGFVVSDWGLREGVLLEWLDRRRPEDASSRPSAWARAG